MRKKILIAEHEVTVADSLERRLRARGYVPFLAADAASALALFDENRPDLVVLSLTLAGDAGREVCRGIRMRPLGALVPILFLGTGREEVRNVSEAIAAGADHFFRKPEGVGELLAKVATYIGPGEDAATVPEPPHAPVPDERELLAALGRPEDNAPVPTPQPVVSGFFRAIRDVLAARSTPSEPGPVEVTPAPEPVPAQTTAAQANLAPEATETDWAALDSLLHGSPLPTPVAPVPSGNADVMRAAAALLVPDGAGALPAQLSPEPTAATESPDFSRGRRWTDQPDTVKPVEAAAVLFEPIPEAPPAEPPAPPQETSPRQSTRPGEMPTSAAARTLPLPTASGSLRPGAMPTMAAPSTSPAVTGGIAFGPPRRPAHDPTDALTTLLDAGRAVALERRGVGELLAAVAEAGLSGRLEVASAGVLRRVFLDGGAPVYADSSEPAEDLVAFLAAEGRLTRAVMVEARDRAHLTGATAEEILIEAGYLAPDDVYRALRAYVIERVVALFALEAGESTVVRGGPRPLDPVDLGMHPGRLVLDGIRRKYGRLRLYRAVGTPATVPRPRTGPRPELPGLVLRQDEAAVLSLIDGRRTALEIARTAQLHEIDTLAVLFGLGVLQLIDAPAGVRPTQGLPALDPEALLRAGAPRTDDQMPGFAELLAQKYSDIQAADYHQILGVPRSATGAEIRTAWERLRRQFDPHRVRRDGPHWAQVREIAAVVDDAYAVLGNERLRARYEAHLE